MALCCIGGVCIPYSAIIPLIIYGIQWLLKKMILAGFFPAALNEALSRVLPSSNKPDDACCNGSSKPSLRRGKQSKGSTSAPLFQTSSCCSDSVVSAIKSDEEWERLLVAENSVVICKFTAAWCKPCKKIEPHFAALAAASSASRFVTVDVDEVDEVAAAYKVMALPTFLALRNGKVVNSYSGSNHDKLQEFVEAATKKTE